MMLWLANSNPAFHRFKELFDDSELKKTTAYPKITSNLKEYFKTRPTFGPTNQNLVDLLRAPALASPNSLEGQLAYMRETWPDVLGDMVRRILVALDIFKEEELAIWMRFHPAAGHADHFGFPQDRGDSSACHYAVVGAAGVRLGSNFLQRNLRARGIMPPSDKSPRRKNLSSRRAAVHHSTRSSVAR